MFSVAWAKSLESPRGCICGVISRCCVVQCHIRHLLKGKDIYQLFDGTPSMQAGIVSIMSSNNNTIITLSDTDGKVQSCISAGCLGFSNSRKSTTQAAEAVGEAMAEKVGTSTAENLYRFANRGRYFVQSHLCQT